MNTPTFHTLSLVIDLAILIFKNFFRKKCMVILHICILQSKITVIKQRFFNLSHFFFISKLQISQTCCLLYYTQLTSMLGKYFSLVQNGVLSACLTRWLLSLFAKVCLLYCEINFIVSAHQYFPDSVHFCLVCFSNFKVCGFCSYLRHLCD